MNNYMVHSSGYRAGGSRLKLRALQALVFGAWTVMLLSLVIGGSVLFYVETAGLPPGQTVQLLQELGFL